MASPSPSFASRARAPSSPTQHTEGASVNSSGGHSHALVTNATGVQFQCQTCRKLVPLDTDKPIQESALLAFNSTFQLNPPHTATDLLSESFVVLPARKDDSSLSAVGGKTAAPASAACFDVRSTQLARLLDLVRSSGQVSVRTPLCTHCASALQSELERRCAELESERAEYARCMRALAPHPTPSADGSATDAQAEAEARAAEEAEEAELARQEAELEEKLAALQKERKALDIELSSLDDESARLNDLEGAFWREYEGYTLDLLQLTEQQTHVKQQIRHASDALDRLKRTNVFDDAFHISHDGHFATINGFRLGRLPAQPVEWAETSAALGQVMLLLHTMARHTGYKFKKYRLLPMGSYSKMARLDDLSTTYELYGSNDLILGRLFWYRRFDTALVWLLECINEFATFAAESDSRFPPLKYPIKGDLINEVSIKLQFNNDAKWTKALKYMLTNLKFLLAWCSTRKSAP